MLWKKFSIRYCHQQNNKQPPKENCLSKESIELRTKQKEEKVDFSHFSLFSIDEI